MHPSGAELFCVMADPLLFKKRILIEEDGIRG